jgi:HK97 family phage prohead protease
MNAMRDTQGTIDIMSNAEIRAVGDIQFVMDGDKPRIDARAIKYDSWSVDLGGFRERIVAGAINLDNDLVALFDHSTDKVLGRVSAGTMEVRQDSQGVAFTAYPPQTSWANDLMVSMKRGDIRGCSFRMFVDEDKVYTDASGQVCRDILAARVSELTITSMPAYPETSAELRSHVEALQSIPVEERAGRVLSTDNQGRLVLAREVLDTATELLEKTAETIDAVLMTVDPTYKVESEDDKETEDIIESESRDQCGCGGNCSCSSTPQNSETTDGASEQARSSVGATGTPTHRAAFTPFGFITTRKDN